MAHRDKRACLLVWLGKKIERRKNQQNGDLNSTTIMFIFLLLSSFLFFVLLFTLTFTRFFLFFRRSLFALYLADLPLERPPDALFCLSLLSPLFPSSSPSFPCIYLTPFFSLLFFPFFPRFCFSLSHTLSFPHTHTHTHSQSPLLSVPCRPITHFTLVLVHLNNPLPSLPPSLPRLSFHTSTHISFFLLSSSSFVLSSPSPSLHPPLPLLSAAFQ